MIQNGKRFFDKSKDREFIVSKDIEYLYPFIINKLYRNYQENYSQLSFIKKKNKEAILEEIRRFLVLGRNIGYCDEMVQYVSKNLDIECLIEFLNRRRIAKEDQQADQDLPILHKTYLDDDEILYVEQDLPMASNEDIERITDLVSKSIKYETKRGTAR